MWWLQVEWKYWVDDGIDGKAPGWYDYVPESLKVMEGIYQEFIKAPVTHS
jgi:hypothetical protein